MWKLLKSLLGAVFRPFRSPPTQCPEYEEGVKYVLRMGKSVKADEAFEASHSGDLRRMLKAMGMKTNPIDRHFLLMSIVDETYRLRKDPKMREVLKQVAERHLEEFPKIAPALMKDMDGYLPRVTTFQKYATTLAEDGEFESAIAVCEKAMEFGLDDGTKSGYAGRIERIKKKRSGGK